MLIKKIFEEDLDDVRNLAKEGGLEELLDAVSPVLSGTDLIDMFKKLTDESDAVLITGIGAAYPLIHVSILLKKLGAIGYKKPLVIFYPGTFNGMQLKLFDRIDTAENEYQIISIA